MNPLVSLVILNYNGENFLIEVLNSLINSTYKNIEILVVDNCSSDNSINIIKQQFTQVKLIENSKNLGFAEGNNVGIRAANGKYICLVNNDLKVEENWLSPLINFLENSPEYAAVQPKVLSWRDPAKFEYAGASGGYIDKYGIPFMRGRILDEVEKDDAQYDEIVEIFWASGAAICFRAAIVEEIGALDNDFFLHQEEIDFCWRMILKGYKLAAIPESIVYHYGGASLGYESPQKLYLNYRNNLSMLIKNMAFKQLLLRMPFRLIIDAGAFFLKIIHMQWQHAFSIFRGYMFIIGHFTSILKKRKKIKQFSVKQRDLSHLILNKSIVVNHFLHKKNKFSDLSFEPKKVE